MKKIEQFTQKEIASMCSVSSRTIDGWKASRDGSKSRRKYDLIIAYIDAHNLTIEDRHIVERSVVWGICGVEC